MNEHKATLLQMLRDLGWILNLEKCLLTPDTTKEYIGFKIVTKGQPALKIPNARVRKLHRSLEGMLQKTHVTARLLARIAGQCIAMTKVIVPGKLLLRNLYRLLPMKTAWDDVLQIDQAMCQDLIWWQEAIHTWNGAPIVVGHVDVQIQTDASETGCHANGCHANRPITERRWPFCWPSKNLQKPSRQIGSNLNRQGKCCSIYQSLRRTQLQINSACQRHMDGSQQPVNVGEGKILGGGGQCHCRSTVSIVRQI